MTRRLSRRTVLRAGGVAVALPFLEAMLPRRRAFAQAQATRKRLAVFFSPNGTIMKNWAPTGGERDFALSTILAPLEPIKKKIVVIQGVDQQGGGAGDGHQNGMVGMLTSQVTNTGPFKGGCGQNGGWANGISVDQYIAGEISKTVTTRFKSLELGCVISSGNAADNWSRMSYAGPDQPVPPEENPASAFARVFGDFNAGTGAPSGEIDKLRAQRKTILNAVMDQYRYIKGKVGVDDGRKLDAHFQAIREIETRLSVATGPAPAAGGMCTRPGVVAAEVPPHKKYENMPVIGKLQMDILAMAFACDLTRVGTLQWGKSAGGTIFSWLGINRGHHDISHAGDSDATAVDQLTKINNWYAQQYLYFAQKLDAIQEPDGTVLDNSVVLWCNELGKGNAHTRNDAPYVLAGSAGRYFETGRYLSYTGNVPHSNLLVSLINAMGIPATTFGKPEWCTGPLARLK